MLTDSLSYKYYARKNRLNYVRDSVPAVDYALPGYEDLDNQNLNNYTYDPIGNLLTNDSEHIINISWYVYGKITLVNYSNTGNSSLKNLYYTYNASGNRISKMAEKL